MKRITLSAAAARLVEQHVSAYEDQRDLETGKPLREPRERRQWDQIADQFVKAAGECDTKIEALQAGARAWGKDVRNEEAALIEQLQKEWRAGGSSPDAVARGLTAIKESYERRIAAKENELAMERQEIELSADGLAQASIDLDDSDQGALAFLRRVWPELDLNTSGRLLRRLTNEVKDALANPVELVRVEGDRYVPKAKLSVVPAESES